MLERDVVFSLVNNLLIGEEAGVAYIRTFFCGCATVEMDVVEAAAVVSEIGRRSNRDCSPH